MYKQDVQLLRELGKRVAEIAALPVQEEKRSLWRALNAKKRVRPMVMMDQVCWNEVNVDDELTLLCEDPEFRFYEDRLRKTLYQWLHFRCDMVVEPYLSVSKAVRGVGLGVSVEETTLAGDPENNVVSHSYVNQFVTEDDLEKIHMPVITHDVEDTERRLSVAHEVFDGVLEVRADGVNPYLSLWDPISQWMGVENALYTIADRPDFMHKIVDRMTRAYLSQIDQLEAQGLLCRTQPLVHCTGAYTDELPAPGYDENRPRAKDLWMYGLAQMFSTVSPAMFDEFEITYASRICERFGLVYYGCCDPLDGKMAQVRKLPGVRKVSISPWANQERGAREIGGDYVFSRKPNPAFLASMSFQPDYVRADLQETVRLCRENNCPLEMILKDISTVRQQPQRLWEWEKIAMSVAMG